MKKFLSIVAAGFCLAASAYENFNQAYKAGTANRSKRNYQAAVADFTAAEKLAKTPSQIFNAKLLQGICLCEGKEYDKGYAMIRKIVEEEKTPYNKGYASFYLGLYLFSNKKYQEAVEVLKEVETLLNGKNPILADRANYYIANSLVKLKKYKEAMEVAEKVSNSKNEGMAIGGLVVKGNAATGLRDKAAVENTAARLVQWDKKLAKPSYAAKSALASCYRWLGRHDEAAKCGREIAECKSFTAYQKAYGNYFMAVSYDSMKKPELAAEQWEILSKCNVPWLVKLAKKNLKPVKK